MDPRSGIANHATRDSKYVNNLFEPRKQHEDDFAYIIIIQKLYNSIIAVDTHCGRDKVVFFKPVDDFDEDGKDIRILVWENASIEHCALIKNIENLLERPNKSQHNFFYCNRCKYWFNSQIKYDKHKCNHSFKPEIHCPEKEKIIF